MNDLARIFDAADYDQERLTQIRWKVTPRRRYIIAMTPRTGSSYLCHILKGTQQLGVPGEYLNSELLPEILKVIPAKNAKDYFKNVEKSKKTTNGVYGLKASWFQFDSFLTQLDERDCLTGYRYIYLTRRNLPAQAVSLYKATSSNVFHTNIQHEDASLRALESLRYDFAKIDYWYEHIVAQEKGWRDYFISQNISPFLITYEEIDEDVVSVVKRIAQHVGVNPEKTSPSSLPSIFKKMSDSRNIDWACRFAREKELFGPKGVAVSY